MKDAMSGTTLFMIVIFFIVLFTGYLCFSINKSRAFNVKNSIVRIVERYGFGTGITNADSLANISGFTDDIKKELTNVGYRTKGVCNTTIEDNDNPWTAFDVNGRVVTDSSSDPQAVFCVKYVKSAGGTSSNPNNQMHYFKIKAFYHFDLPVLNNSFNMTIEGNTKPMQ